jgi:2-iminobutanoate/2-iminopropanoate deaminase
MTRQAIQPPDLPALALPFSQVIASGELVFTAGQVGTAGGKVVAGGVGEQTRQALENVRACLRAAGCDLADVLKMSVFLADLADFDAFNAAYAELVPEPRPVRTTVQAGLLEGLLVEIDAVARRPR